MKEFDPLFHIDLAMGVEPAARITPRVIMAQATVVIRD